MKDHPLFDPRYDEVVRRNFIKMYGSFDLPEEGKRSRPPDFTTEMRKEVIRSKLKQRRGLDNSTLRYLIFSAAMRLKIRKIANPGLDEFEREFRSELDSYEKRPRQKVTVLCPLNAQVVDLPGSESFVVQECSFFRTSWENVHALPGWKEFLEDAQGHRHLASTLRSQKGPMHKYFTPYLVEVIGRDVQEVFQAAYLRFELMRSILNLFANFGRYQIQFGKAVQLGAILPPVFFVVFAGKGNYSSASFNEEPYDYSEVRLNAKNLLDLNAMLSRIDKMDSEIKPMFVDSLVKYVHAMDTIDWRDAFLTLWQVLENLSLSPISSRLKMDEVCSRIKNLMGLTDLLHKELIDAVVETRNSFVHLGKFSDDGLMEVQYLKMIVELALSNFYVLSEKYCDKHSWEEYYSLVSLNESVLDRKKKAIESVIQLKHDAKAYLKKAKKP
jgi:hypothetical protein